jgi:4'-phosphopantetheinyl transferase
LWLVACDEIKDPRLLEEYRRMLSDDEHYQQQRFYFAKHRHQYLITRAAVRTVLSHYSTVEPAMWCFDRDEYGRPFVRHGNVSAEPISFNVSHTDGLVLVGVTRRSLLGVDTESTQARRESLKLAHRFFSPEEAAALSAMPEDTRSDRFLEYWTLKESYIKARGLGLSIPLDLFSFYFDDTRRIGVAFRPQLNDDASRWCFWLMRPLARYVVAVCAQRMAYLHQELVIRKVVPLELAERIDFAVSYESS